MTEFFYRLVLTYGLQIIDIPHIRFSFLDSISLSLSSDLLLSRTKGTGEDRATLNRNEINAVVKTNTLKSCILAVDFFLFLQRNEGNIHIAFSSWCLVISL